MDTWLGQTKHELIMAWGAPSKIMDDGNGGEILIYEYYRKGYQTPGTITGSDNKITYTNPENNSYIARREFFVNSEGKIYHWRWRGL